MTPLLEEFYFISLISNMKKHIVISLEQLHEKLKSNPEYLNLFKMYDYRGTEN